MLKVIATVVRQAHIAHEELVKVWEEVHAPHVKKIAQPQRYRLTFFDPQQTADDPGLDGMAELWFRDKRRFDTTIGREAPPVELLSCLPPRAFLPGRLTSVCSVASPPPFHPQITRVLFALRRPVALGAYRLGPGGGPLASEATIGRPPRTR